MAINRTALVQAVTARVTVPNVTFYLVTVPQTPPTISADDLRVRPYVTLHPGGGLPSTDRNQADDVVEHAWTFQLNVVAGDPRAVAPMADLFAGRLEGWQPVDDPEVGRCRQLVDLGNALTDHAVAPPRFWLPLIYQVAVGDPREPA